MNTARSILVSLAAGLGLLASPLAAQVETVDPDDAYSAPIDGDLEEVPSELPAAGEMAQQPTIVLPEFEEEDAAQDGATPVWSEQSAEGAASAAVDSANVDDPATTYREDDLIGAAEGVFGKGAEGVAQMIQNLLKEQGEPNGYIVGREAGGAFVVGARYGSGTLFHKVEGEMPVYWTGPSIGFDAGANAGSTFVLVYNLYDTEELYERFPAAEGQAYIVGGLTASYVRKGDVVLIPIRMGAGLRLGVNAGYLRFSKKQRWLPF